MSPGRPETTGEFSMCSSMTTPLGNARPDHANCRTQAIGRSNVTSLFAIHARQIHQIARQPVDARGAINHDVDQLENAGWLTLPSNRCARMAQAR